MRSLDFWRALGGPQSYMPSWSCHLLFYSHAEFYRKISNFRHCFSSFPPYDNTPFFHTPLQYPSKPSPDRKSKLIKIIIMKGRPNNLTKTLLRAKSPPLSSKNEPATNKNPERNIVAAQMDVQRFSSSDTKPKLPPRGDQKLEKKSSEPPFLKDANLRLGD